MRSPCVLCQRGIGRERDAACRGVVAEVERQPERMVGTVFQSRVVDGVDERVRGVIRGHERCKVWPLHRHVVAERLVVLSPAVNVERWFEQHVGAACDGVEHPFVVVHALIDLLDGQGERYPSFVVAQLFGEIKSSTVSSFEMVVGARVVVVEHREQLLVGGEPAQ